MNVISCPGCGRRLDAAIAICPDCNTTLREEKVLSKSQQEQRKRAEEAEARFRANAEAAARENGGAVEDAAPQELTLGERYMQAKAQRLAAEKRAAGNVQLVVVTDVNIPMSSLFFLSLKLAIVTIPALVLAAVFFSIIGAGMGSWLSLLR